MQRVAKRFDGCGLVRGGEPRWETESHVNKACAVRVGQPVAGFMHESNDRKPFTLEGFGMVEFTPIHDSSNATFTWWGAERSIIERERSTAELPQQQDGRKTNVAFILVAQTQRCG